MDTSRVDLIVGKEDLGTTARGTETEIGTYIGKSLNTELSGNVIAKYEISEINIIFLIGDKSNLSSNTPTTKTANEDMNIIIKSLFTIKV